MRLNIFYGSEPRITTTNRHDFDQGNYECALIMRDRRDNPVFVSRSRDPSFPVWKIECGYSCYVFSSREQTMAFCEKRYRKTKGG